MSSAEVAEWHALFMLRAREEKEISMRAEMEATARAGLEKGRR